jgi:hypothetical protein
MKKCFVMPKEIIGGIIPHKISKIVMTGIGIEKPYIEGILSSDDTEESFGWYIPGEEKEPYVKGPLICKVRRKLSVSDKDDELILEVSDNYITYFDEFIRMYKEYSIEEEI